MGGRADADGGVMAGGEPEDVLRSLRRYAWLMVADLSTLEQRWRVRLQRTRVADEERPVAIIDPGVLTVLWAREGTIRQGDVQKGRPFTATFYPEVAMTPARSAQLARLLEARLDAGFTRGLVSNEGPQRHIGGPFRVPVYDFDGVPIDGPERGGPDEPYMHANIVPSSLTIRPIQDPLDERRYTVVLSMRLAWWQAGRWTDHAPVADDMGGRFQGTRSL